MKRVIISLLAFLVLLGCRPVSPTIMSRFYIGAPQSPYREDLPDGHLTAIRFQEGPPTRLHLEGALANNGNFDNLYSALNSYVLWGILKLDNTSDEVSLLCGIAAPRPNAKKEYETYRLHVRIVDQEFQTEVDSGDAFGLRGTARAREIAASLDNSLNGLGDWLPKHIAYVAHWPTVKDDPALVIIWERP